MTDKPLTIPLAPENDAPLFGENGEPRLSETTYQWSVRLFSIFRRLLRVRLNFHYDAAALQRGQIFLFNHFSRFETFIPQYLFYQAAGVYCRSIASAEFFASADAVSSYLLRVGAVPNNLPNLLPFLGKEALRGHKVIVFPEGGMVKDRRVLDLDGEYRIYSRSAADRRKHHAGGAVLAIALERLKQEVRHAHARGDGARLEGWSAELGFPDVARLVEACRRPTVIVPANITFYPIRVSDNLLRRGAEILSKGLSPRMAEELLVEGNILFKDTDMDIRLGDPVEVGAQWWPGEQRLFSRFQGSRPRWQDYFLLGTDGVWRERLARRWVAGKISRIRDAAMRGMYAEVTVNLSHLASFLILELVDQGIYEIDAARFHRTLYLAIKGLQQSRDVHLHVGLLEPSDYRGLLGGGCHGLEQFLEAKVTMALLERRDAVYRFLPKLLAEHAFDEIRLENLVAVYANEVAPIKQVSQALRVALASQPHLPGSRYAELRFDDQLRSLDRDCARYRAPRYRQVQDGETAREDPSPFFFRPEDAVPAPLGVLLVHGFLASPAEMRGFGQRLHAAGYPVLGVRLKGHGTSPWDLRAQPWTAWLESVREGFETLAAVCERVCVVGFSTGASLALRAAVEPDLSPVGVVSVSAPLRFRSRAMTFVPLVHGANKLVRWVSSWEGVMPFRANESENPHINYRQIPIRGLYELRRLTEDLELRLPEVDCPVLVLQGDRDPVVDPESARVLARRLPQGRVTVELVPAEHHGILYRDTHATQARIAAFIAALRPAPSSAVDGAEATPARAAR